MFTITHHTVNTGHSRQSPRSEVEDSTMHVLDPLVAAQKGWVKWMKDSKLGFSYEFIDGGECCAIKLLHSVPEAGGQLHIASAMLAWDDRGAETSARMLRTVATSMGLEAHLPDRPAPVPLLLILLLPDAVMLPAETLLAMADFERCLAWTILAREGLTV